MSPRKIRILASETEQGVKPDRVPELEQMREQGVSKYSLRQHFRPMYHHFRTSGPRPFPILTATYVWSKFGPRAVHSSMFSRTNHTYLPCLQNHLSIFAPSPQPHLLAEACCSLLEDKTAIHTDTSQDACCDSATTTQKLVEQISTNSSWTKGNIESDNVSTTWFSAVMSADPSKVPNHSTKDIRTKVEVVSPQVTRFHETLHWAHAI